MTGEKVCEDEITPEELDALKKFKGIIMARGFRYPKRSDDHTLTRFLRARQLDPRAAATMYGEYIKWRLENKIDTILETFTFPELDKVLEAWPQNWHKTDKCGRPVNIQLLNRTRVQDVFKHTTEDRLLMRTLWVFEELHERKLPACSKAAGHVVGRATVILDLNNISITGFANVHARRLLTRLAHIFSRYYPEYLGRLIIINVPSTFKVLWDLIRPFIDDQTNKKIGIHKGNGLQDLLNTINVEDLPDFLGGQCHCPGGCEKAVTGPWSEA